MGAVLSAVIHPTRDVPKEDRGQEERDPAYLPEGSKSIPRSWTVEDASLCPGPCIHLKRQKRGNLAKTFS